MDCGTRARDRWQKGDASVYSHPFSQRNQTLIFLLGTFHPRHVIQATGHSGEPYFPSDIKGLDDFKGDRLVHSSQFTGPQENGKGKKAVIVGCCNSAHDIAQDYYEHGYDVTMVQRSSTLVVTGQSLFSVLMKGLYDESGVSSLRSSIKQSRVPSPDSHHLPSRRSKRQT